ncbi:MAG TPA: ATP-binding cassette domain-containing protein [Steroidobacteraceae bacterium]|jgi:ABC-2 type transport system ATP-binding protein|nr:ATP-binding cassette domain-containing protein [Steroidobacteraceae bacterium]
MIEIESLTKRYGTLTAVDGVSFRVQPGEVLGFLGPNGAGKSTTMRMIAGYLAPTSGSARVCGHDVERDPLAAKSCMGYMPEGAPSYGEMTVRRFLDFIADVRALQGERRRNRLNDVIERLHLGPVLEQTIETLSKGFRCRVGLAQAILHDPQVLILDEPTDGLDPNQKHEVRTLINAMAADKIIVISTHILEEVDAVCTRAIIISKGKVVADEKPQSLAARSRYHNAVTVGFSDGTLLARARAMIASLPQVAAVEARDKELRLTALPKSGQPILPLLSDLARREQWSISELHLESGRLDEVFRAVTQGA